MIFYQKKKLLLLTYLLAGVIHLNTFLNAKLRSENHFQFSVCQFSRVISPNLEFSIKASHQKYYTYVYIYAHIFLQKFRYWSKATQ